jgi:hypothetical protein
VRISRAGLQAPNRPVASFLFLGPTGVGKVLGLPIPCIQSNSSLLPHRPNCAKLSQVSYLMMSSGGCELLSFPVITWRLSMFLLGSTSTCQRYVCSVTESTSRLASDKIQFHDRHTISRLIGAAPGYVGFEEGGKSHCTISGWHAT